MSERPFTSGGGSLKVTARLLSPLFSHRSSQAHFFFFPKPHKVRNILKPIRARNVFCFRLKTYFLSLTKNRPLLIECIRIILQKYFFFKFENTNAAMLSLPLRYRELKFFPHLVAAYFPLLRQRVNGIHHPVFC